jgi:hypothetical protein
MARQPRLINDNDTADETIINGDTYEGFAEDVSDLQNDIDATLDKLFMEIGDAPGDVRFKCTVYRIMPNQGEKEYCFAFTPAELPILDRLRDEYGGGKFEIFIYKNGKIFKRPVLNVAKPPAKPAPVTVAPNSDMNAVVNALMESQRQQAEQMREFMQRGQSAQPAPNMLEMMGTMMGVMSQMKSFIAPANPSGGIDDFIKMLNVTRDLVGEGGGEKSMAESLLGLAKEFGPPLLAMSGQLANAPRPAINHAPQYTPVQSNPVAPMIQNQPQPQPQQEGTNVNLMLKAQIGMLVNRAAAGADPSLYGELVADQVNESTLREFIARPDALEFLAQYNSAVLNHREWFTALRDTVAALLTDADLSADTAQNPLAGAPDAIQFQTDIDITSDS